MASDALSEQLVDSINASYGVHPGYRAAHAKGVLCATRFTPTAEAARLSRAPHFAGPDVHAHVRFSNGSGNPTAADGMRDGRGMAVKFYLSDGATTDIVAISLPAFFARDPPRIFCSSTTHVAPIPQPVNRMRPRWARSWNSTPKRSPRSWRP